MNFDQGLECAELICSAYPNTAGRTAVINAYAKQLMTYPYEFTGPVLLELPGKHEGQFCPSIPEIQDALIRRYVLFYWAAVTVLAEREYALRYLPGNDDHRTTWLEWYRTKVNSGLNPERETVLRCLREEVIPSVYLERIHRPLGPREGGPIAPPVRKDREPKLCAAVRFGDWNGLLAMTTGETP